MKRGELILYFKYLDQLLRRQEKKIGTKSRKKDLSPI